MRHLEKKQTHTQKTNQPLIQPIHVIIGESSSKIFC